MLPVTWLKKQARGRHLFFIILRDFFMWYVMAKLKYIVSGKKYEFLIR